MNTLIEHVDIMYTNNSHGLSLLKFKGVVCGTVYEDSNFQIFHTEEINGVYDKRKQQVYSMTIEGWTRMVLKIESAIKWNAKGQLH